MKEILKFAEHYGALALLIGLILLVVGQFTYEWIAYIAIVILTPVVLLFMYYAVRNGISDFKEWIS